MTRVLKTIRSTHSFVILLACVLPILRCSGQAGNGNVTPSGATGTALQIASAHRDVAPAIPPSRPNPHEDSFVIGPDDILAVNVFKEAEISRTVTVRSDGKISLPLLGEVQAGSKTPKQLETDIGNDLSAYIPDPAVTVIVQEIHSLHFIVLGKVQHPGSFPLTNSATVLDAIALAGGFLDFAKQKSIYILRSNADGTPRRIAFNYKEVVKGKHPEENVKLQSHDTVVVP